MSNPITSLISAPVLYHRTAKLTRTAEGLNIESHSNDKGSWYNVMVGWGKGETITESLTIIIGGDTVTCYFYVDDGKGKGE